MTLKKIQFAFAGLLLFPLLSLAQGTKIGVVDAETVVQKSVKGQAFFEEVKKFNQGKADEIDTLIKTFNEKQKDAQAKAASMSEDKRQEVGLELQRMQTDIKRKREDAERESKLKVNGGLDAIQKELMPLVRQVALEKGLDLVINYGQQTGIVFFSEKIDITSDVIAKYDEMAK